LRDFETAAIVILNIILRRNQYSEFCLSFLLQFEKHEKMAAKALQVPSAKNRLQITYQQQNTAFDFGDNVFDQNAGSYFGKTNAYCHLGLLLKSAVRNTFRK
jgi:hypothetical protein